MKRGLVFLSFIISSAFAFAQDNAAGKPAKTIQPKIIVIPRVADGEDMKQFYDHNMNIQIAIAKINQAFQKRGANLRSFDQTLKQMQENKLLNKPGETQEDVKSSILQSSGADIFVETKLDVVQHTARNAQSVNLILDAYQVGTGNSLASIPVPGPMFQTEDIGVLTMMAIDKASDEFLNLLQLKFNDIVENGQSVYVEFSLSGDTKYNFDSEMGTEKKLLSELLDDWFQGHAKNGVYNNQGVTTNKLIISDVRIPLKRPDNPNQNYTGQNLFTDISRYLRSIGLSSRREIGTNNKILITIL